MKYTRDSRPPWAYRWRELGLGGPAMPAAGTFGYGCEIRDLIDIGGLGAIVTKSITPKPKAGNPPPRLVETPCGLINSVGLENVGIKEFKDKILPGLLTLGPPVVVSVAGERPRDYGEVAGDLAGFPILALELNLSCPNVDRGGLSVLSDPDAIKEAVASAKEAFPGQVWAKIGVWGADPLVAARAAVEAGADAIVAINTLRAIWITPDGEVVPGAEVGGLSGPGIRPVALYAVRLLSRELRVPVIGVGGIDSAEAAKQFFWAGATAVQVGTGLLANPNLVGEINRALSAG